MHSVGTWASFGQRGSPDASATDGLTRGGRAVPDSRPRGAGVAVPLADRAAQHRRPAWPAHTGLAEDLDAEANRLLRLLVLPVEG